MNRDRIDEDWFEPFSRAFTWLEHQGLTLVICRQCDGQFQFASGTDPARIMIELDEHLSALHGEKPPQRG